jgi:hypothetical protein
MIDPPCSSLPPLSVGDSRIPHAITCLWFWIWAVVGATGALGLVSLGPLALVPAIIAAAAMARNPSVRRSALGLLAGAGFLSLFVAYVQRQGPRTTCWHTATASGCDQHLNPIPWLVVGLALVIGAVVAQQRNAGL